jgi:hypothetical protein
LQIFGLAHQSADAVRQRFMQQVASSPQRHRRQGLTLARKPCGLAQADDRQ